MEENDEKSAAIELDEADKIGGQPSGNDNKSATIELDDPEEIEEQSAANEFGEAEDNDEEFSGNELGEAETNDEEFSGNELDGAEENDEEFSGNELDEAETNDEELSGDELDEPEDETSKSITDQGLIKGIKKIYKGKGRVWMFIAIGLFLLSGIGYLFIKGELSPGTSNQKEGATQFSKFAIPKGQVLVFDSFVIPFKQSNKFSYISLTIAFKLQNKELEGEMIREKCRLRGIIYDMLSKEIIGLNDVPSLEKVKDCIIRAVNGALYTGKINDAYIIDLIAV